MTLRMRLTAPLLASAVVLVALFAGPLVARADTLSWAPPYVGPANIPNGEAEPIDVAGGFNAVSFADAAHGWAVGVRVDNAPSGPQRPLVAFTADGAMSWSLPSDMGTITAELTDVLARSDSDVWVTGKLGTLAHYDGISWTKRTVPGWTATKGFQSVAFADALNGWAVGDSLGVARTVDGGATWSLVTAPGTSTTVLRSVAAVDAANAIAVGDAGVMKLISGGAVYAKSSGTGSSLYAVAFADSTNGWAVGDNAALVRTTNGGVSWTSQPVSIPVGFTSANLKLRSVAFADPLNGIAVGTYQWAWRTTDGGLTWTPGRLADDGTSGDVELRGVSFVPGSTETPVTVARGYNLQLASDLYKARAYRGTWLRPDETPPTTVSDAQTAYLGAAVVHLAATDNVGGSGVAHTYYILDGGPRIEGSTVSVTGAGDHTLEFWSVDVAGNPETPHGTADFSITVPDTTPPITSSDAKPSYVSSATIRLTAVDEPGGSGVARTYYALDGGSQTEGTVVNVTSPGDHTIEFWSVDVAGNPETPHGSAGFTITVLDTVAPTTVSDAVALYADAATIHLTATDVGGSGVAHTYYRIDNSGQLEGTTVAVSGDGPHVLEFWSVDVADNPETPHKTAHFSISTPPPPDTTAPTTLSDAQAAYVGPATIHLSATDNVGGSGVAHTYYQLDGAPQAEGTTVLASSPGSHTLKFWSVDVATNTESTRTAYFTVTIPDTTPPTTNSDAVAAYESTATIHLSASDVGGSGVAHTYYVLDGGPQREGAAVVVGSAGSHDLEFWSVDGAGNPEAPHKTASFVLVLPAPVDLTAPSTVSNAVASYTSAPVVTLTASDDPGGSGVAHTYYSLDGGAQTEAGSVTVWTAGRHTINFWSVDRAGNVEAHKTVAFSLTKLTTSLSIKTSASRTYHGRSIKLSGTLRYGRRGDHVHMWVRKSGGSWGSRTVSMTSSAWSTTYKFSNSTRAKGTYYFYVQFSEDASRLASKSSQIKVVVIR